MFLTIEDIIGKLVYQDFKVSFEMEKGKIDEYGDGTPDRIIIYAVNGNNVQCMSYNLQNSWSCIDFLKNVLIMHLMDKMMNMASEKLQEELVTEDEYLPRAVSASSPEQFNRFEGYRIADISFVERDEGVDTSIPTNAMRVLYQTEDEECHRE